MKYINRALEVGKSVLDAGYKAAKIAPKLAPVLLVACTSGPDFFDQMNEIKRTVTARATARTACGMGETRSYISPNGIFSTYVLRDENGGLFQIIYDIDKDGDGRADQRLIVRDFDRVPGGEPQVIFEEGDEIDQR